MNNKFNLVLSKSYNTLFAISLTTSVLLLLIFLTIVLNIKFLIYPSLITKIVSIIPIPYLYKYCFGSPSNRFFFDAVLLILNNGYLIVSIFISTVLVYFLNIKYRKLLIYKVVNLFIFLLLFLICLLFCQQTLVDTLISQIFLIFFIYIFFNFTLREDNFFTKLIILMPLFNILLVPIKTINYVCYRYFKTDKLNKIFLVISLFLIFIGIQVSLIIPVSQILNQFSNLNPKTGLYHINTIDNTIYYFNDYDINFIVGINTIDDTIKLNGYALFIEENKLQKQTKFKLNIQNHIEDFKINSKRQEIYVYDAFNSKLLVLDFNTGNIKKEKNLSRSCFDMSKLKSDKLFMTSERICFDNDTQTIAIALEHSYFYILDINTLEIIRRENIPSDNDSIIFNKADNSYILSFWSITPFIFVCPVDSQREAKQIDTPICQGELAYSDRNKEIYLALHQHGQIYVYDAATYSLKRKIKVRYGVKNLNYNEKYNILLATSYYNGYLDVISIDDYPNKIIYSTLVHYHVRRPIICDNLIYVPTISKIYKYNISSVLKNLE